MSTVEKADLRATTRSVYVTFIFLGVAMASFAARIPQIRDRLGLTPSELGLVLLAIAAGSITSLPLAGHLVHRFGSRAVVGTMAVVLGTALAATAVGYEFGVAPVVVALYVYGFATGAWDVAMNVQAAVVERRLGRSIMSRFHAGYSVGTVAGALAGAGAVKAGLPVTEHVVIAAVIVTAAVVLAVRGFMADEAEPTDEAGEPTDEAGKPTDEAGQSRGGGALAAWREPRTLLIGLFVLAFALTEGAGIDWISIALIDDYGTEASTGTLGFALFLAAMTVGRWFGPNLLDRYGRVTVLRLLAVTGLAGLLVFVFGPHPAIAFVGALFWGLGASLGFPVGMSAAADEPAKAPARVGVVASIGYCAFLGGPPLIGFLGDHVTVSRGLLAVAMLLVLSIALTPALREPSRAEPMTSSAPPVGDQAN